MKAKVKYLVGLFFLWHQAFSQIYNQSTLTIQSGANLYFDGHSQNQSGGAINNAGNLHLKGDFNNSGTALIAGKVIADGTTSAQTISGNSNFNTFEIDNASGVAVSSGATVNIVPTATVGSLNLKNGTFTAPMGTVALKSNSNGTAYLDNFSSGMNGLYNPSSLLTVERYIPGGTMYHYLSTPVSGTFIGDWADDFSIAGQDGFINDGVTNTFPWPTLWRYEESNTSPNMMIGWIATTGSSQPLDRVRGYACLFSGTTVDVTGTVSSITPTRLVSHTTSTQPLSDGWNLVGNPFPSILDWDLAYAQNSTRVAATIYQWKVNQYVSYNALSGVSINGGSDQVASSQGFFIRCNASGNFTLPNNTRATGTNAAFFKQEEPDLPFIRLGIGQGEALVQEGANWDETVVYSHIHSSDGLDEIGDAEKLLTGGTPVLSLFSIQEERALTMNAFQQINAGQVIPLGLRKLSSGKYTFLAKEIFNMGGLKVYFEDRLQGQLMELQSGSRIEVLLGADEPETGRFFLRFGTEALDQNTDPTNKVLLYMHNNTLNLVRQLATEPAQIDLLDMSGKRVAQFELDHQTSAQFACQALSKGVYIARYRSGETMEVQKVVVE